MNSVDVDRWSRVEDVQSVSVGVGVDVSHQLVHVLEVDDSILEL